MAYPVTGNSGPLRTEIAVGTNECRLSVKGERLVARRVFSDVVIAMHVPSVKFAGLLRFTVSSEQSHNESKAVHGFLEAALAEVFDGLRSMGSDPRNLAVYVIGGAVLRSAKESQSAKRLYPAARRAFWQEGIVVKGDDLGGHHARSIWLDGDSGRLIVRSYGSPADNPSSSQNLIPNGNQSSSSHHQFAC